jgi:purine-binding chemotaxis protein CheW
MMNIQNAQHPIMPTHGAADAVLASASDQFITFTLGAEEYGVDIMAVQEIKGWTATTAIPNAPPFMRGVINLRGIIVPIVDLRARFGMTPIEPSNMHVVIIITTGGRTTGLLVDAVSDIISVAPDAIRPVPEIGATGERMLSGLVALDDRMVSLVTLEGLIASAQGASSSDGAAAIPN